MPTPWLDDAQQRSWRVLVEGSAQLLAQIDRQLRETNGLTLAEYEILVQLTEDPGGRARMAALASRVSHSRARLSQTVGRLERDGLVRREPCADDKRGIEAVITDRGRAALESAAHDHVREVRRVVVDVLTPAELAAVGTAMAKVRGALEAGG